MDTSIFYAGCIDLTSPQVNILPKILEEYRDLFYLSGREKLLIRLGVRR